MSKTILDHQQKASVQIVRSIKEARDRFERQKTLQLQGNHALQIGIIEGYFNVTVPTSPGPNTETVTITAPTAETIMIGSLMWSMFYIVPDGSTPTGVRYDQYDTTSFMPLELDFNVFLAYDQRGKGSGLLTGQQAVFDTIVADNQARLTAKVNRTYLTGAPSPTPYVTFFWALRATMM